jgi:hypothetical protein
MPHGRNGRYRFLHGRSPHVTRLGDGLHPFSLFTWRAGGFAWRRSRGIRTKLGWSRWPAMRPTRAGEFWLSAASRCTIGIRSSAHHSGRHWREGSNRSNCRRGVRTCTCTPNLGPFGERGMSVEADPVRGRFAPPRIDRVYRPFSFGEKSPGQGKRPSVPESSDRSEQARASSALQRTPGRPIAVLRLRYMNYLTVRGCARSARRPGRAPVPPIWRGWQVPARPVAPAGCTAKVARTTRLAQKSHDNHENVFFYHLASDRFAQRDSSRAASCYISVFSLTLRFEGSRMTRKKGPVVFEAVR